MSRKHLLCVVAALVVVLPSVAFADSIAPSSFGATLGVGESVTIKKTVTIDASADVDLDVFFLFDITGSMGSTLTLARNNAITIVDDIITQFGATTRFGVGTYQDFPVSPFGSSGDSPWTLRQDLTTDAAAKTALGALPGASGGNDTPEAQLHALTQASSDVSWRTGSARIVIWFGDAPGHFGGEQQFGVLWPGSATTASTILALGSQGIVVEAIDVSGIDELNARVTSELGTPPDYEEDQATNITTATGGSLFAGLGGDIVTAIKNAILAGFFDYTTVGLDLGDVPAGVGVSYTPAAYVGTFDRSIARMFGFDVTFTGLTPGSYTFPIWATVDGGRIVSEIDRITVGIPEPTTLALLGLGVLGLGFGAYRRRFKK